MSELNLLYMETSWGSEEGNKPTQQVSRVYRTRKSEAQLSAAALG